MENHFHHLFHGIFHGIFHENTSGSHWGGNRWTLARSCGVQVEDQGAGLDDLRSQASFVEAFWDGKGLVVNHPFFGKENGVFWHVILGQNWVTMGQLKLCRYFPWDEQSLFVVPCFPGTSGVTIAIINHYRKPLQAIQPSLSHHLAMIKASNHQGTMDPRCSC